MNAYKLSTIAGYVVRTEDGANIGIGAKNSDANAYAAWLAAGNAPDPAYTTAELRLKRKADAEAEYVAKIAAGRNYTQGTVTKNAQIDGDSQRAVIAKGAEAKFFLYNAKGTWNPSFAWRMTDNSFLPMTAQQMSDFADNISGYVEAMDFNLWTHVDNLTNPASPTYVVDANVATYDVTVGWPTN